MRKSKRISLFLLAFCMMFAGILFFSDTAHAKGINNFKQAKKLAKKQVKGATITEVDMDYDKGVLVYEIKMVKGAKEYDLEYRASDAKLIAYGWDTMYANGAYHKKMISQSKCKKLAKKKVPGGTILSIVRKHDDGIDEYKLKMKKSNKKYELKYHARTGKLLAYEWEITSKTTNNSHNGYIGIEKAKQIALSKVPGGTVVKVKLDKDDGIAVYEVEIIKGYYEYEIEIDARTGEILKIEKDYDD